MGGRLDAEAVGSAIERLVEQRSGMTLVKLGGSALDEEEAVGYCLRAMAVLHRLRFPLMVVHGGGKAIDRAMQARGLTPRKVAGRRYTDASTLAVVVDVLQHMTKVLTQRLGRMGVDAVCGWELSPYPIRGEPWRALTAEGSPIDIGWVGTISALDSTALLQLVERGQVPVFPSLAAYDGSPNGWLNVNADTFAARLAGRLGAKRVVFLTDTVGVLRVQTDPSTLLAELTAEDTQRLIAEGVISGGMIPKVEACLEALASGAHTAVILDGRRPWIVLEFFLYEDCPGTRFLR
jgi:acetylglutamate kinase